MMHEIPEELAASPSNTSQPPARAIAARDMVFYRRPDLSGHQLLFQRPRGAQIGDSSRSHAPPAQLVALDGQSKLGLPLHSHQNREPRERQEEAAAEGGRARPERLPRLLVATNPLDDEASKLRLRRLQINVLIAAAINLLATVAMLTPTDRAAWFHVDSFTSIVGSANINRVRAVRDKLLVIAATSNMFFVVSTMLKHDLMLTVYILGLVVGDIWTIVLLMPHAFFVLRILLDMVLVALALEVRSNLEYAWFLTSFHRLRH